MAKRRRIKNANEPQLETTIIPEETFRANNGILRLKKKKSRGIREKMERKRGKRGGQKI